MLDPIREPITTITWWDNGCRCIIWHAHTPEERERTQRLYDRCLKYNDSITAAIYHASLTGKCLARKEEEYPCSSSQ